MGQMDGMGMSPRTGQRLGLQHPRVLGYYYKYVSFIKNSEAVTLRTWYWDLMSACRVGN